MDIYGASPRERQDRFMCKNENLTSQICISITEEAQLTPDVSQWREKLCLTRANYSSNYISVLDKAGTWTKVLVSSCCIRITFGTLHGLSCLTHVPNRVKPNGLGKIKQDAKQASQVIW